MRRTVRGRGRAERPGASLQVLHGFLAAAVAYGVGALLGRITGVRA